jgi:AAA+ ATPase superfamily predicted ATPase
VFVDREYELETLEREYGTEGFRFTVVYGRRRVGKTTLIQKFVENRKHIYFLATLESEPLVLEKFQRLVAEAIADPLLAETKITDFSTLFRYLSRSPERIVVVIDEFQYLVRVNPALPSLLQAAIDTAWKSANIHLILCGSIVSMMYKEVLSYASPLYGRRTSQLKMGPLPFRSLGVFFPDFDEKVLIEVYAVFGGIPKYLEMVRSGESVEAMVVTNVLEKDAYLYNEPYFLLQDEVSETLTYFSILETIAGGAHKVGEIASRLGKRSNDITSFMQKLIDLEILEKEIPVTEKNPAKSKKGLYFIKDHFLRFWFRYVFPYRSQLEIGNTAYVRKIFRESFEGFVANAYEKLAIDFVLRRFGVEKCGRWWDGKEEIDLVGFSREWVIFGEVKWRNRVMGPEVLEALMKKSEKVEVGDRERRYILFSKSGFDERVKRYAKERGVILVEGLQEVSI